MWRDTLFAQQANKRGTVDPDDSGGDGIIDSKTEIRATEADFFNYTTKRWLYNEEYELSQRRVRFSIPDLFNAAVEAAGDGATKCLHAMKYREGQYNKTFRLDLDNGSQIVVKLPNPNAGPLRFTTASEVATMDYIRNELKIPVPKVLAWNSGIESKIGTEYIIMEPAKGHLLSDLWYQLDEEAKYDIITQVVKIQATLAAKSFPAMGSLYYKDDIVLKGLPTSWISDEALGRFTIGPMIDPKLWDMDKFSTSANKGPWRNMTDYSHDLGLKESAWLSGNAEPRMNYFREEQEQPGETQALIGKYLAIAPLITQHSHDQLPITAMHSLSHLDLNLSNIFIDPQTNVISDIIDWQASCIVPLLLQARLPRMVRHVEDLELGLFMPQKPYPEDNADEKTRYSAERLHQSALCQKYYETRLAKMVPDLYSALLHNITYQLPFIEPLQVILNGWKDRTVFKLRASLIKIVEHWQDLFPDGTPCPISFDEQTISKHDEELENLNYIVSLMETFEQEGILPADGIVGPIDYDALQEVNADQKRRYLTLAQDEEERENMEKIWPWQDWPERARPTVPSTSQAGTCS